MFKKIVESPIFWRIFLMGNIMWAIHATMFCVLCFNNDMQKQALFMAIASFFHVRLAVLSGDKIKELEKKDDKSGS